MNHYSFSYINQHGCGDVFDVKDMSSDQEAIDYARQTLESSIWNINPQPHASGFQDPYIAIDKWGNGYPGVEHIDEEDPIGTAYVIAAYDDGTYNDDCTELNYHCEIKVQEFE